jgi:hypothetical protein
LQFEVYNSQISILLWSCNFVPGYIIGRRAGEGRGGGNGVAPRMAYATTAALVDRGARARVAVVLGGRGAASGGGGGMSAADPTGQGAAPGRAAPAPATPSRGPCRGGPAAEEWGGGGGWVGGGKSKKTLTLYHVENPNLNEGLGLVLIDCARWT